MGFSRRRVQEALRTVGSGLERALSWLIDGQASSEGSVNGSTEGEGEERELSEVGRARNGFLDGKTSRRPPPDPPWGPTKRP